MKVTFIFKIIKELSLSMIIFILVFMFGFGFSLNSYAQATHFEMSTLIPYPVADYFRLDANSFWANKFILSGIDFTGAYNVADGELVALSADVQQALIYGQIVITPLDFPPIWRPGAGAAYDPSLTWPPTSWANDTYDFLTNPNDAGAGSIEPNVWLARNKIDVRGARLEGHIFGDSIFWLSLAIGTSAAMALSAATVAVITGIILTMLWIFGLDIAEKFPTDNQAIGPGDVLTFNKDTSKLMLATSAYDKKVIGIVSTDPALVLGSNLDADKLLAKIRKDIKLAYKDGSDEKLKEKFDHKYLKELLTSDELGESPIALVGTAPCKVDASYAPINIGDFLTTSNTPGYAMKAQIDSYEKIGSVFGRALEPLESGRGTIKVLIVQR